MGQQNRQVCFKEDKMTKQEMDAYCAGCKNKGCLTCNRSDTCNKCEKQEGCLEICVREHRDGIKFRGGRGYNA